MASEGQNWLQKPQKPKISFRRPKIGFRRPKLASEGRTQHWLPDSEAKIGFRRPECQNLLQRPLVSEGKNWLQRPKLASEGPKLASEAKFASEGPKLASEGPNWLQKVRIGNGKEKKSAGCAGRRSRPIFFPTVLCKSKGAGKGRGFGVGGRAAQSDCNMHKSIFFYQI